MIIFYLLSKGRWGLLIGKLLLLESRLIDLLHLGWEGKGLLLLLLRSKLIKLTSKLRLRLLLNIIAMLMLLDVRQNVILLQIR